MKFGSRMALMGALLTGANYAAPPSIITDLVPAAPGLDRTAGVTKRRPSKGKQAKPKKRPNMLRVSKRVRRKHRRCK